MTTPDRNATPHVPDDLDRAWTDAVALADDGTAGPAPAVRANVLAAAREMAAQAAAASGVPPLAPVAAPVAPVGRGRPWAVNLSSWRVRAGGAVFAALLVAISGWRLTAHRFDGGEVQLAAAAAAASDRMVSPLASPPPDADASAPVLHPSAVDAAPPVATAAADAASSARNEVLAQADVAPPAYDGASGRAARGELREAAPDARSRLAKAAAPVVVAAAAPPAPVSLEPSQAAPAAEADAGATVSARSRAIPSAGGATLAAADAARKSAPALQGALRATSLRALPTPLQAAADRGDLDTLRKLLADPAARVDAPDAAGRTALLHAVLAQHLDAVRVLLAAGADPERADQSGLTPRAAARDGADGAIATLLAAPR